MRLKYLYLSCLCVSLLLSLRNEVYARHTVARLWNDMLLESIRNDYARPTIHARNLWHVSIAMYDAWAAYDSVARPYLLGDTVNGTGCPFSGVPAPQHLKAAREEAISFAAYRIIRWRYRESPGVVTIFHMVDSLMYTLGYDTTNHNTDYTTGDPAALGNYIAQCVINFGLSDGAYELDNYENQYYEPVNPPLVPMLPGNPDIVDPNRWQPLTLDVFIDQAGNVIPINTPEFLSPEWGNVYPFSLTDEDMTTYTRDGDTYRVFCDPGMPPHIDTLNQGGMTEYYKWNFALVAVWSSHLDPSDSVMWDISPASMGNIQNFPDSIDDYQNFYNFFDGGDIGTGYAVNPKTGQPYTPQIVPRGDYARVIAEFWADGPDSETPPGHWFTILNYVMDQPQFHRKWRGMGAELDSLEYDVKAYFALGGAMHDAAIAAWSIKGYYDYVRPISAIRYMADQGQSSDTSLPNYNPNGIPLFPGYIEVVLPGDPLAGPNNENVGKIKLYAWKGPDYINDPAVDEAGVGWILAENWWPYQRPSFVTPPFAGYVSGHSTYSRAAAEVLTLMTGDPYFPGGMSGFNAPRNQFLVFEEGPSTDIVLQWATYRDASDQCSLSRIWGGIHPPADDIPGRKIGMKIGPQAFALAEQYFRMACLEPVQLRVKRLTPNSARLTWAVNGESADATSFQIRGKALGSNNWKYLNVPADQQYKDVYGLLNNTTYIWQVKATCTWGNSLWSAPDTFTTGCYAPDSTWASPVLATAARLNWEKVHGAAGYEIRGRKEGGPWIQIGVGGGNTVHKDLFNLQPGSTYYWRIRSWCDVNGIIKSAYTAIDTFTTPASGNRESMPEHEETFTAVNGLKFYLMPNPAGDVVTVTASAPVTHDVVILVKDYTARVVKRFIEKPAKEWKIDLTGLPQGIYLVDIVTRNGHHRMKLIKGE